MATINTDYRQAITTYYISPTNFKGSRVKATCEAGSVTLHWDDALNQTDNHAAAASALIHKLSWNSNPWQMAGIRGRGFVFVQVSDQDMWKQVS
jgi:hypothetical protein